jgi:hypothetical protein
MKTWKILHLLVFELKGTWNLEVSQKHMEALMCDILYFEVFLALDSMNLKLESWVSSSFSIYETSK